MVLPISPRDLAKHFANGHPVVLVDVRQPWENQLAALPNSLHIPLGDLAPRSKEIAADAPALIVVYCHHGIRSLSAGAFLERLGFTNVHSLTGGIDAWSCEVDPTVARY
jgi:adenylyltransferase/sulfurtransferase